MSNTANRCPDGWDQARVRGVIRRCESQTDDEGVTEDAAVYGHRSQTVMLIHRDLVPAASAPLAESADQAPVQQAS